jgi:hypothetical protein
MLQAFKIIRGFDKVDSSTWFQKVDASIRTTRSAADPLNLRQQAARLETRRNFFSNRVVEAWNLVPGGIKRAKTVNGFKNAYKNHRVTWWRTPRTAKKRKTACGETTSGTRHILRGPTWAIGCNNTRTRTILILDQDFYFYNTVHRQTTICKVG